jgi:hypothetical protein
MSREAPYFDAALAALIADEAESIAEEAEDIADVAADEAAASVVAGAAIVAGGVVVVVVVVSSFLLQAAKETAAASVTISNAVFIFLLDLGSDSAAIVGTLSRGAPSFKDKESGGIPVPNPRL